MSAPAPKKAASAQESPDARFDVCFPVQLSWQAGATVRRITARCLALSPSAMNLETQDRIEQGMTVLVHSHEFGRMGLAAVGCCNRHALKYEVELRFGSPLHLGDPARQTILEELIRKAAARKAASASKPERPVFAKQLV
jgi:hypothetical protein